MTPPNKRQQHTRREITRRKLPSAQDRAALIETLQRLIECRQEIRWAYLHGSFLEGGPYRDVDIAVWVDPTAVFPKGWRWYEVDLATTLELRLHQPVDIRVLNDAPLAFRYHALKGQLLLVRDWEGLNEMRTRTGLEEMRDVHWPEHSEPKNIRKIRRGRIQRSVLNTKSSLGHKTLLG